MIKREIEISGKKVPFRSSATIPRLYRAKFKRDIFKDLSKLEKSYRGKTENGEELQIEDLEIFENVAYVMAYHADNSIPANIEDWLDQFDTKEELDKITAKNRQSFSPYLARIMP